MANGEGRAGRQIVDRQMEGWERWTAALLFYVGVWKQREEGCTYSGRLELWAVTSSVWDGAGRSNGWAHRERCFLIEMGSSSSTGWADRETDRHHETTRPGLRTDRLARCLAKGRQTIARHRHQHRRRHRHQARPGRGHSMGYYLDLDMRRIPGEQN